MRSLPTQSIVELQDSAGDRVNPGLFFSDLELNGMSSSDSPDVPPPLPLKGSTADYGNLLESQDLISPTTSPPAHQRVSAQTMIPPAVFCSLSHPRGGGILLLPPSADPEDSAV